MSLGYAILDASELPKVASKQASKQASKPASQPASKQASKQQPQQQQQQQQHKKKGLQASQDFQFQAARLITSKSGTSGCAARSSNGMSASLLNQHGNRPNLFPKEIRVLQSFKFDIDRHVYGCVSK